MIWCLAKRSVSCLTLGNYNHVADFEQQELNIIPILLCSNVTLYDIVVNFVIEHASILLAPWAQWPLLLCSYSSTREEWVGTGPFSTPLPSPLLLPPCRRWFTKSPGRHWQLHWCPWKRPSQSSQWQCRTLFETSETQSWRYTLWRHWTHPACMW